VRLGQLPVTLPTAAVTAAAAAYLNARIGLFYDRILLSAIIPTVTSVFWRTYRGRANQFYLLEHYATSTCDANRTYIRFEDKTYTFAQTYDIVLRYAAWLKTSRRVQKGDVVALDFQNTDSYVFLIFALWSVGATPALINYNLSGKALAHCIQRASANLMLIDPVVADNVGQDVRSDLPQVRFEVLSAELEAEVLAMGPVRYPDELRNDAKGEDLSILIYTSGTTGLPKAAIVSWNKLSIVGMFTAHWIGTKSSDTYFTVSGECQSTAGCVVSMFH
jgi:acyl-CoA synthetase (AMP-forming)/AMP-acid ligase II